MPDDRMIHKSALRGQRVGVLLTDFERGVWLAYQLCADDYGVMRFSAQAVQEAIWLEKKPRASVQRALERIREVSLIHTFEHQDELYCYQRDWNKRQKVRHPRSTIHPCPPMSELDQCETTTAALFLEHHGKIPAEVPESFGGTSETFPPLASAGGRETLTAKAKGNGLGERHATKALQPSRGIGAGVMAGSLPRDHVRHAWCGRVCVPDFLHGQFASGLGTDNADSELRAFYAETLAGIHEPIGEDPVKFWKARVALRWPGPNASEGALTTALRRASEEFLKS